MKTCTHCGFQNPDELHICLRCAAMLRRTCKQCGTEVPFENKFCGQCGARIEETAPLPDQRLSPTPSRSNLHERMIQDLRAKMPAAMINKIHQVSNEMVGQRREVTVLCVDIANLPQAYQSIDSEDLYLAVDELMHLLTEIVYRYEGTIDKFTGEGLLALFGIPLNHENDPERAVRAALDMLFALDRSQGHLQSRYHFDFRIRVGMNTGSVIVGAMGTQQHVEYTVIGDTVNLATGLQNGAVPGQALVSFSTYQRTRPIFDYRKLELAPLTDSAAPIQAYQPLGLRLKPGQVRGLPGIQVPMIGRVQDLNALQSAIQFIQQKGDALIILASGEAGMGKSRLVAEFRNAQEGSNTKIYSGTCAAYMRITSFRVVADVIRSILQISELDPPDAQREALQNHLEQLSFDSSSPQHDILPNLLHVMGLLQTDPVLEVRLKLLEPSMLQHQTQLALRAFFLAVARQAPTALVFDDLHWVDQASRQFLEYFCQSISSAHPGRSGTERPGTPLLLILIARDFEKLEHPRLIREAAYKHNQPPILVQLEPLPLPDAQHLVNQFIREASPEANRLKSTIIHRSGGNPYYTEELVRILMDYGGLSFDEDVWHVTNKADELLDEVPGTLQDILLARFDRLPEVLRQVAQKASILGNSFTTRLLKVLFTEGIEDLNAHLQELEQRDFLTSTNFGSQVGYLFKHPLLQETIYKTLLKRDLRKFHFAVARAIESSSASELSQDAESQYWLAGERNEILAQHYAESTQPSLAIPYLLASAEKASQLFANETVIHLYRRALALMETTPEPPLLQIDRARIGLAQALKFTGQFEEAIQLLQEVINQDASSHSDQLVRIDGLRELADIRARAGDLEQAVQLLARGLAQLGEDGRKSAPTSWRRLADRLAWVYFRQGKLEEAHNLADLALMDVKSWEADDPITMASLHNTIGGIYWTRSRHMEAIESVERSLSIYQNLGYQWGTAISLTNLGVLHFSIGKWPDSVSYLERADQMRSEFGNDPERPNILVNLGEALLSMGDYQRARTRLEISIEICRRLGLDLYQVYGEFALTRLALLEDNTIEASQHLQNARRLLEPLDETNERAVQFYGYKALIEVNQGHLQSARESAEHALQIAELGGFQEKKIDALRISGMTFSRLGHFVLAEEHLQQSLELAHQNGERFLEGQALTELAESYLMRAQQMPNQETSAEQYDWYKRAEYALNRATSAFEELGAQRELHRAQALRTIVGTGLAGIKPAQPNETHNSETIRQVESLRKQLGLPEGEWHQAAILALNLVPNQEADEELLFETSAYLLPLLTELIQENDGQILRYQNGLAGIFGAPLAHEDDPERAVETAMQIVNFYNELYQQTRLPMAIRLGISMGKIVAGKPMIDPADLSRANLPTEFMAAGEPLQIARALAEITPPAHIWVTQAVRNTTLFRFNYSPLPEYLAENVTFSRSIYQFDGVREQILPVRGLHGLRAIFVGRQAELLALEKLSQNLFLGKGGLAWVEGDPGIGKSRLTREFEARITEEHSRRVQDSTHPPLILRGTCTARRSDFAFSVFSDLLSSALDIQSNFTPSDIYRQVEESLREWPQELKETRPFLEMLVGVQPSGALGEQLVALEPEQLRRQTFVAINRLCSWMADRRPLILILDDVQWIDAISADLLLYLTPLAISHPLLFICAQRLNEPSDHEKTLAQVRKLFGQSSLHLQLLPLSIDECHSLLSQFLSRDGGSGLDQAILSLIVQQSGGNPYFIEEFVRMLVEQDYLRVARGGLEVNQTLQVDTLRIPSSLETLIRARVDSLPTSARELLQVASIIGHRFASDLLAEIAQRRQIGSYLEVLHTRGMLARISAPLAEISSGRSTPASSRSEPLVEAAEVGHWEFSHPMIEGVVYNTVLKAQRRILHHRTALALETHWRGVESEHAEDLAYHFAKAEQYTPALGYLILAGERAAARHANDAAVAYFEQASDMLSAVPQASAENRWRIICGLGEVYQFTGNYAASLSTLQTGAELLKNTVLTSAQFASLYRLMGDTYQKKGDLDQAIHNLQVAIEMVGHGRIDLHDPASEAEAARIYARLGWSYFIKADFDNARDAVLKAENLARNANNLNALAAAENLLGGIHYRKGDLLQAVHHTRQAMTYWQELGYSWGVAVTLSNLGILEVTAGDWKSAADSFRRALRLRQEMGDVEGVAIAHNNLGHLGLDQGKLQEAETSFRSSLEISGPFQMTYHKATSYQGLAQALLDQASLLARNSPKRQKWITEAEEVIQTGSRLAQEIEARELQAEMQRVASRITLEQGQIEHAEQQGREAITLAMEIGSSMPESGARRAVAEALLRRGQAEQALQTILEVWERLSPNVDELETGRVHAQLAKIYQALQNPVKTELHRNTARQIFERLGAAHDLLLLGVGELTG